MEIKKRYKWIKAIAIVKFDIEIGMVIEQITPNKALTEQETKSVATLSFPESNCSDKDYTHTFFYRFKTTSNKEFFFGYSYYIQHKDLSLPRGYLQKSLVIITSLHFSSFYLNLVQLIGDAYFNNTKTNFLRVFVLLILKELYESTLIWPSLCSNSLIDDFDVLVLKLS